MGVGGSVVVNFENTTDHVHAGFRHGQTLSYLGFYVGIVYFTLIFMLSVVIIIQLQQ